MPPICVVVLLVILVNLPCGFYRAGVRRFTLPWIVAVHAPVPVIIGLRYATGLGWRLYTFPMMIGAYALGQFLGGRLRRTLRPKDSPRADRPPGR